MSMRDRAFVRASNRYQHGDLVADTCIERKRDPRSRTCFVDPAALVRRPSNMWLANPTPVASAASTLAIAGRISRPRPTMWRSRYGAARRHRLHLLGELQPPHCAGVPEIVAEMQDSTDAYVALRPFLRNHDDQSGDAGHTASTPN
jgi:hypothetical protein